MHGLAQGALSGGRECHSAETQTHRELAEGLCSPGLLQGGHALMGGFLGPCTDRRTPWLPSLRRQVDTSGQCAVQKTKRGQGLQVLNDLKVTKIGHGGLVQYVQVTY